MGAGLCVVRRGGGAAVRRGVAAARLPAEGAGAAFQSRTHGSEPCVQRRAGSELLPQLGRFPENAARGGGARHGERAVRPPLRRVLRHRGGSGGGVRDLLLCLRRSGGLPQDESGNPSFRGNRHPHGKGAADSVCRFRGGHQRHSSGEFLLYGRFPRAALGYKQWDYFSRYLSTALATLVHGGDYLADAAPLPQILAMLIMAVSGILMGYIVYERTTFSGWELAVLSILGLNPYFLGCVSFRFDAPYMALSVLAAVVPLLCRNRNTAAYVFASGLGILAVCTSYQAAAGIFPMLVVALALRMWNRGESIREVGLFCLKSAAGYALGLIFFKLVIMIPADTSYVGNALPPAGELIPHFLKNLRSYYSLVLSDFKPFWLIAAVLAVIAFCVRVVLDSRRKTVPAIAMTAAALVLMGLMCFGLYPALAATVFAPRAMYGFGVLLTVFGMTAAEGKKRFSLKIPAVVLSWVFFVFAFTYGNALSVQKDYTDFRTQLVISDLQEMEAFQSDTPVTVQLSGSIGNAPVLRNMPQNYQMLNRLIPGTFGGGDDLTQYGFYCYYGMRNVVWNPDVDLREMDLPVVEDNMYHTIRGEGSCVLVELK
ncbi:MAG: glucosyltransferase domain-containing protein [Oscillospiraceae bacterium]